MFKAISVAVVALLAALLIYASTKPDTFRVERSTRTHGNHGIVPERRGDHKTRLRQAFEAGLANLKAIAEK